MLTREGLWSLWLSMMLMVLPQAEATEAVRVAEPIRPEARLLWPDGRTQTLTETPLSLRVAVRVPDGSVPDRVLALVDGREIKVRAVEKLAAADALQAALRPQEQLLKVTVANPPYDCSLSILVEHKGATSEPARLQLYWKGPRGGVPVVPKLYVVSIGVSAYRGEHMALTFPHKDAADFVSVLSPQVPRFYHQLDAHALLNGQATRSAILGELQWLAEQTTDKDVTMVFLAGHGVASSGDGEFYFVPYDGDLSRPYEQTLVSGTQVRKALEAVAGKVVLFLDACHGGAVLPGRRSRGPGDVSHFINELQSAAPGVVVFSATRNRDVAQEWSEWGNGVFTKALVEGLAGRADRDQSGRVTVNMLGTYVIERVKSLTEGKQKPVWKQLSGDEDYPLALSEAELRLPPTPTVVDRPAPKPARRPVWRLTLGGSAIGVGLLLMGFGTSALAVNNQIIDSQSTTPGRLYATANIGGGLLGAGAAVLAGGILCIAWPERSR